MQINVAVTDANNIVCQVVPPQTEVITIDRGVAGNGIVSIVPVTISTFQYLRITYTNGTVQDVGPLTSTAYTATAPITIVGNTISLATVPIASGGTDATTAAGAIQNLLPSYTGNANKRLGLNSTATGLEWVLDGGGTVTSIAASGGTTGLTFSGSPITTSGTLTLGGTLGVANGGTGATTAGDALTNLGAIGAITSTDGSVTITSTGTSRDLSVAVAAATNNVIAQVRNTTGATLAKGTVVYISGATGQVPTVSKAIATGDATSAQTLGMITADLPNNSNGNVTIIGLITNIDTSAYTDGAQLYLSGTTAGAVTATKPYAPIHLVYVAVVEYAHPTQGKLFVKVQNGYELDEIHDVSIVSPVTGQTLVYNSTTDLWVNNTVSLTAGVNGTLPIANGGTGQTTANAALNALLPTQTGNASKYLQTDGTNATWDAISLSTADITGILPTANGGTGLSSFTANGVVYASSTSALTTGSALTFDGTRLTSTTGKFGSGAASNSASLMVNNATNTATGIQLFQDGIESWIMGMPANSAGLAWSASGSEQMRLTATGLGIGTSSVGYKLQVFSGSSGATSAFTSTNATAYSATSYNGATARILLQGGAASGAANGIEFTQGGSSEIFFGQVQESTGTGAFVWQGYDGSYYVERARLSGAGNFGVGTTTPAVKIHSQGQSSAATIELLRLSNIGAGANTASQLTFWAAGTNYADIIGGYGSSAPRLSFNVAGGGYQSWAIDGSDKLFLNTYGHFGVGTTSPVSNGGNSAGLVHISTSTVDGWAINHYTNGTTGFNSADGLIVGNIASDAYIFNYENANVIFGTNAGEKARINASGELLIGRTSSSGLGQIQSTIGADLATDSGNVYLARGGGNVGIGTASPNATLQLSRNGSTGNFLVFDDIRSGYGDWAVYKVSLNDLTFGYDTTAGSAPTQAVTFAYGGNVGIGTSSPSYKLTIAQSGSVNNQYISLQDNQTGGHTWNIANNAGNNLGAFGLYDVTAGAYRLLIDASGNVGIGTSSPSNRLTVSNSSGGNVASFTNTSSADLNINLTSGVTLLTPSTSILAFGTSNTERVRIGSNGNLGISTTATDFKVTTQGFAAYTNNTNNTDGTGDAQRNGIGWVATGGSQVLGAFITASNSGNWGADIQFFTRPSTGGNASERARIDSSGNLLVGTTSSSTGIDTGNTRMFVVAPNSSFGAAITAVADSQGRTLRLTNQARNVVGVFDAGNSTVNIGSNSGNDVAFLTSGVERARIDTSGRLIVGASSNTSSGDAVLAVGGGAVTIFKRATLATGATLDITVGTSNIAYWSGFLCVLNSDLNNGGNRTQTNFSICAENQTPTFTTATLQTVNGALGARTFTITYVDDGIIRLTNTSGFTCVATMSFFGGGANLT